MNADHTQMTDFQGILRHVLYRRDPGDLAALHYAVLKGSSGGGGCPVPAPRLGGLNRTTRSALAAFPSRRARCLPSIGTSIIAAGLFESGS